jgi:signal transduction histidine kinase
MVLLVGIASLPLKPLHMLSMGMSISAIFLVLTHVMGRWDELTGPSGIHTALILVIVLVCTGLTAVIYKQRADAFRARRLAEQSFEELHRVQVKLLVSENAASQKRLAAAMSHELNTPLGVLASAFDTVRQLYEKKGEDPDNNGRLQPIFDEAVRSGRQSSERLRDAVQRLKQLTSLDRAEEQVVDLNEVWSDTVTFLRTELEAKADVSMDLTPLPRVKCRPQQLSAVFSNLLRNAAAAITERGKIAITSDRRGEGRGRFGSGIHHRRCQ